MSPRRIIRPAGLDDLTRRRIEREAVQKHIALMEAGQTDLRMVVFPAHALNELTTLLVLEGAHEGEHGPVLQSLTADFLRSMLPQAHLAGLVDMTRLHGVGIYACWLVSREQIHTDFRVLGDVVRFGVWLDESNTRYIDIPSEQILGPLRMDKDWREVAQVIAERIVEHAQNGA